MATVYTANVAGTGQGYDAYRPAGFDGVPHSVLMLTPAAARCMVLSDNDAVTGTGIAVLLTRPSWTDLVSYAKANNPNTAARNRMNTWLASAGLAALTAAEVSYFDCIQYMARQVTPSADLSVTARV